MKINCRHISNPKYIEVLPSIGVSYIEGYPDKYGRYIKCVTILLGWLTESVEMDFEWVSGGDSSDDDLNLQC